LHRATAPLMALWAAVVPKCSKRIKSLFPSGRLSVAKWSFKQ
jgi:hypothetical protein